MKSGHFSTQTGQLVVIQLLIGSSMCKCKKYSEPFTLGSVQSVDITTIEIFDGMGDRYPFLMEGMQESGFGLHIIECTEATTVYPKNEFVFVGPDKIGVAHTS